jgi:orotidine-5'-phosphate decarboxylase
MAIINVSRSILYASGGEDFADVARREAIKIRDEINFWREKFFKR